MNESRVRILVVDDEVGIRCFLSAALGIKGYQIATAGDGFEAIELVKKEKFKLIISDVIMPKMDGFAMVEEIRKIDPAARIVLISGLDIQEMVASAVKKRTFDFIQKPFDLNEVGDLIDKVLGDNLAVN